MQWTQLVLLGAAMALFLAMLALQEAGRRIGKRRARHDPDSARVGAGVIEAAVFALLGLLLAFQFSGAAARLDWRRRLVVEEANAIGTAWLRLDLLTPAAQPPVRDLFRQYADARIRVEDAVPDRSAMAAAEAEVQQLQGQLWSNVVTACRNDPQMSATMLLVPALNQVIDITTTRSVAVRSHVPALVVALLIAVALLSALLAGHAMSAGEHRNLFHMVLFAAVTSVTIYVIFDMEFPRAGFIRIGAADEALRAARQMMQ